MQRELRCAAVATLALIAGVTCAESYSRWMAPYYTAVGRLMTRGHPWQIREVALNSMGSGAITKLRLVGMARRNPNEPSPAIQVESSLEVGGVAQLTVVFWAVLIGWSAPSWRRWLLRLAVGVPVFLALEIATTVCQLVGPLAQASEYLAGVRNPVTPWELWSRFLEAGGRPAMALVAALITLAIASRLGGSQSNVIERGILE